MFFLVNNKNISSIIFYSKIAEVSIHHLTVDEENTEILGITAKEKLEFYDDRANNHLELLYNELNNSKGILNCEQKELELIEERIEQIFLKSGIENKNENIPNFAVSYKDSVTHIDAKSNPFKNNENNKEISNNENIEQQVYDLHKQKEIDDILESSSDNRLDEFYKLKGKMKKQNLSKKHESSMSQKPIPTIKNIMTSKTKLSVIDENQCLTDKTKSLQLENIKEQHFEISKINPVTNNEKQEKTISAKETKTVINPILISRFKRRISSLNFKKTFGNRIIKSLKKEEKDNNKVKESDKDKEKTLEVKKLPGEKANQEVYEMKPIHEINKEDNNNENEDSPLIDTSYNFKFQKKFFIKKAAYIILLMWSLLYISISKFIFFKNFNNELNSISDFYEQLNNQQACTNGMAIVFKEGIYRSFTAKFRTKPVVMDKMFPYFFEVDKTINYHIINYSDFIIKDYKNGLKMMKNFQFCNFMHTQNIYLAKVFPSLITENCLSIKLLNRGITIFTLEMIHGLFELNSIYRDMITSDKPKEFISKWKLKFMNSDQINNYFFALPTYLRINIYYWKENVKNSFLSYINYGVSIFVLIFSLFLVHMMILIIIIHKSLLNKINIYLEKIRVLISMIPQMDIFQKKEIMERLNQYL